MKDIIELNFSFYGQFFNATQRLGFKGWLKRSVNHV
jgi:hypothetical protein